jgi:hypothetical protein
MSGFDPKGTSSGPIYWAAQASSLAPTMWQVLLIHRFQPADTIPKHPESVQNLFRLSPGLIIGMAEAKIGKLAVGIYDDAHASFVVGQKPLCVRGAGRLLRSLLRVAAPETRSSLRRLQKSPWRNPYRSR